MVGSSNGHHALIPREIVYETSFELSALAIGIVIDEVDLEGVLYNIARLPEAFHVSATDSMGRDLCSAIHEGTPRLAIWFSYDDDMIHLQFVTRL